MTETIIRCDVCQKPDALKCYFTVDRRMAPAGDMEDLDESMDLCRNHQWSVVEEMRRVAVTKCAELAQISGDGRRRHFINAAVYAELLKWHKHAEERHHARL